MRPFLRHWLLSAVIACLPYQAAWADVVIANASVSVEVLSRNHLFSLFSMRTSQWPDGQAVSLVVFADQNPTHIDFVKETLSIFPYQLRNIWDRYIFSGAAQAPVVVSGPEEMLYQVSHTVGAIGYLESTVDLVEGVHVIEIE